MERKKLEGRFRAQVSMNELASVIIVAYLTSHEQDILEDVTDEAESAAATYVRPKRRGTGLPSPTRRPIPRRLSETGKLPKVPDAGRASATCCGGTPPTSAADRRET
jgi:hypothetical protein